MKPVERLRFKVNPPNVAIPSDFRDIKVNAGGVLVIENPGGSETPVASGGTLNNAAVNTAIAEDPAASQEAMFPEGSTLAVDGVELGQQGNIIQEESGQLIRNGNGLAWSDAVHTGGGMVDNEDRIVCAKKALAASYTSVNLRLQLGRIWIPARYAVDGAAVTAIINGQIALNGGTINGATLGWVTFTEMVTNPTDSVSPFAFSMIGVYLDNKPRIYMVGVTADFVIDSGTGDNIKLSDSVSGVLSTLMTSDDATSGTAIKVGSSNSFSDTLGGSDAFESTGDQGFYAYLVLDIPAGSTATSVSVILECSASFVDA